MKKIKFGRFSLWHGLAGVVILGFALITAGCSGGGSGSSNGTLSSSLTDGPSADFSHAYVTITQIKLHQSANAFDVAQPGWVTFKLPSPLTVDLNSLGNGALQNAMSGISIPAGTYGQIRLILAAWDDPLTVSAQAKSLFYNDTIVENDGVTQYPLEIAYPKQGIALNGTFTVTADQNLNIAIEFDVGDDVVRFKHGAGYAYTLNPILHYYDLSQAGAINGQIDTSVCGAASPACSNVIIKAEALYTDSSNITYHRVVRWTVAKPDGTFSLYPLPAAAEQTYDIMVRARYAQTVIIQSVPVTAGSTPSSGATMLTNTPLQLASATEYAASIDSTKQQPLPAVVRFYQTPASTDAPYEIRTRQTDPFLGTFYTPEPMVAGNISEGTWVSGGNPTFTQSTPVEGTDSYQVWFNDPYFTRTLANTISSGATTITGPTLLRGPTVATLGTITGSLSATTPNKWTSGQLVVVRFGRIVNTVDVSLQVSNGGTYTITSIPAGSSSMTFPQGYYYAYLRLLDANSLLPYPLNFKNFKIVRIPGFADLRTSGTATLNATLP